MKTQNSNMKQLIYIKCSKILNTFFSYSEMKCWFSGLEFRIVNIRSSLILVCHVCLDLFHRQLDFHIFRTFTVSFFYFSGLKADLVERLHKYYKEVCLTLNALIDSSFWFDTINLGWSIVYKEGL